MAFYLRILRIQHSSENSVTSNAIISQDTQETALFTKFCYFPRHYFSGYSGYSTLQKILCYFPVVHPVA
jgi:hypothetical protein